MVPIFATLHQHSGNISPHLVASDCQGVPVVSWRCPRNVHRMSGNVGDHGRLNRWRRCLEFPFRRREISIAGNTTLKCPTCDKTMMLGSSMQLSIMGAEAWDYRARETGCNSTLQNWSRTKVLFSRSNNCARNWTISHGHSAPTMPMRPCGVRDRNASYTCRYSERAPDTTSTRRCAQALASSRSRPGL